MASGAKLAPFADGRKQIVETNLRARLRKLAGTEDKPGGNKKPGGPLGAARR
ncbi:MAG TPA: hypothetical protein VIK35_10310 [Verrucomicrobiae bacterium]